MSCEVSPKPKSLINELSPRKFPRSPIVSPRKHIQTPLVPPKTPPQWKKPDDVMRTRRLRIKKNALTARLKSNDTFKKSNDSELRDVTNSTKRSNPFRCVTEVPCKKLKEEFAETQNDDTLFKLLGINNTQENDRLFSITSQLASQTEVIKEKETTTKALESIPIDWTIRNKIRFISSVPFPWNQTLKTCEEASSITGFVRCFQEEHNDCNGLDSSPNVEFHQCTLYWQHPNLPWLQLFPRTHLRRTDSNKVPFITSYPQIKDSLLRNWSESFRSLFQLVRARHCPFFYMIANSFNCLFRAAGINGCTETNAIISPTTRGFRKLLTDEGIEYSMPLKAKSKRSSQDFENGNEEVVDNEEDEDEAGEAKEWLASMGVGEEEIRKISLTEANNDFNLEKRMDGHDESLVYIEGCEINAFFNFLINCRTLTVTTGPLAGVPPTLLSPIAFYGGTLASLKVRESTVNVENEKFFSLEIQGPVLPHAVHNLCNVLKHSIDKFSITFANIESSRAFSLAVQQVLGSQQEYECNKKNNTTPGQTFSIENLSDCGLKTNLLSSFCSIAVQQFDCIKYCENSYICS